jgi:ribosomal protein L16 Arg81 hydroxylase
MLDQPCSLGELLAPLEKNEFLAVYWQQRPLVVQRSRPDYYASVLTLRDVDRMLFSQEQRYPAVRLAKVGSSFQATSFTEDIPWGGSSFDGVIRADALLAEYRAGATVIIDALHRTWKPITLLCRSLEAELNHPTQVNVYLTPPNAQGFGQHYDTHDAFILQAAGHKYWRIYDAPLPLPLPSQPYDESKHPTGQLIAEVDLAAGDLVYIPRGYVHQAMTSDSQSLHVTLGVAVYTWMDVFAEALNRCREDPGFRESLPPGFGSPDAAGPAIQARFRELAQRLSDVATVEELFSRLDERFVNSRRPLLEGQLAAADRLGDLTTNSVVRRPPHIVFRLRRDTGAAQLFFHGKELAFPAFAEPALRYITQHAEFRVGSLPNGLTEDSKLVLVRRLIREGFLWPMGF